MTEDDDMLIPPVVWKVIQSVIWSGIATAVAAAIVLGIAWALLTFAGPAGARDLGQWGNQPDVIRRWFQGLMQPDAPKISCCSYADSYEADLYEVEGDHYVAIITDGSGDPDHDKAPIPNGTRIVVPNHKIKWDQSNPTGHGWVFLAPGTHYVFCYVPPAGV